jgi:hypothetical protein
MTAEDFESKFQKTNSFDKYWNYFISILIIGGGLYFLYLLNFTEWYDSKKTTTTNAMPIWGIYIFIGFFIALGLYGFWRIPQAYKITLIKSVLSIEEKSIIIHNIISDFKLKELERDQQYWQLRYVGRFKNRFDIHMFYDPDNFYFNVQQIDSGNDGGFIDFGTSKRVTNKIKNKILAYL